MNKTRRTPVQIRAESVSTTDEFLSEMRARVRSGGLTRPSPVVANLQRRGAFKHLSKMMSGLPKIPKLFEGFWCLVGNSAAVMYGTTRQSDNIDIMISHKEINYRETEQMLLRNDWEPVFVDSTRIKHHPDFVVRSWWLTSDELPKRGKLCRRLNFVVPAGDESYRLLSQPLTGNPSGKNWPVCSLDVLFAMKCSLARPTDIADLIEIVQGGAGIRWWSITSLMDRAGLKGTDVARQIEDIASYMKKADA